MCNDFYEASLIECCCFMSMTGLPSGYPSIKLHPELKSVEKGLSTIIKCDADGDPKPTITWLKDMIPVDLSDPRILLDNGKCVCSNSGGTRSHLWWWNIVKM